MKRLNDVLKNALNGALAIGFSFHVVYSINDALGFGHKQSRLEDNVSVNNKFSTWTLDKYTSDLFNLYIPEGSRPLCYKPEIEL